MDNLKVVLDSLNVKICKETLKKLIELNPSISTECTNNFSVYYYNFVNSDGELVCVLPYSYKIPASQQCPFWFAVLMTVDNNKLF